MSSRRIPEHRRCLGTAIRKRRLALTLSQEQLAELADCHRNYVGNVERGEQNITIDVKAANNTFVSSSALTRSAGRHPRQ